MAERRRAKQLLRESRFISKAIDALEARPAALAAAAQADVAAARRDSARADMASVPIGRLKETAKGLRTDPLEEGGYHTVADVLDAREAELVRLPGVGEATARRVVAGAQQLRTAAESTARIQFDVDDKTDEQTRLLVHLRRYALAQLALDRARPMVEWFRSEVTPLAEKARPAARFWLARMFVGSTRKVEADAAADTLDEQLSEPNVRQFRTWLVDTAETIDRPRTAEEIWADYEENAAELLGALDGLTGSDARAAGRGHLPAEIVERVQAIDLDRSLLKVGLRGYQAFGAKFAIAQGRTILGDEMGLGKTVEALGALCHLSAQGHTRALVVCPASVVANWRAEITRHTHLIPHVVHGSSRDRAHERWLTENGVAITTYESLRHLDPTARPTPPETSGLLAAVRPSRMGVAQPLAMLVVDEAHYVKNPETKRSQAVNEWARHAERVLFLTGTPMENRVEEFQALVGHLQPDVGRKVDGMTGLAGAVAFQTAVAPVYIRRNQSDVLDELPDMIPSLDWVEPTSGDLDCYRQAVESDNFMAMRRAAYLSVPVEGPGTVKEIDRSAKLARLVDIVEEAGEEGLKVIVFSYFRDVLTIVSQALELVLPGAVYGPLTGSTPPNERQRLIEALTDHEGSAVLVAQIEAGGVGLNIQAASVVILCEPQWKPSTEAQAIARSHRMGQVRRVQVHRLLLEDSVDQQMLAVLAGKQELIERFVRGSAIKDASPAAVDISDLDQVQKVVNETQAERLIITAERRRLGLDAPDASTPPTRRSARSDRLSDQPPHPDEPTPLAQLAHPASDPPA
jgi:superfamily II DNA or RNA helicase